MTPFRPAAIYSSSWRAPPPRGFRPEAGAAAGSQLERYHGAVPAFGSPPGKCVRQLLFDQPIA